MFPAERWIGRITWWWNEPRRDDVSTRNTEPTPMYLQNMTKHRVASPKATKYRLGPLCRWAATSCWRACLPGRFGCKIWLWWRPKPSWGYIDYERYMLHKRWWYSTVPKLFPFDSCTIRTFFQVPVRLVRIHKDIQCLALQLHERRRRNHAWPM